MMFSTRAPVGASIRLAGDRPAPGTWKYPRDDVVVEYKPHNAAGIRDGIRQLRSRPGTAKHPRLVTYQRAGRNAFVVRVVDPAKVRAAVRKAGPPTAADMPTTSDSTIIAHFSLPAEVVNQPMTIFDCPTRLGVEVERFVDKSYSRWMGIPHDPKPATANGPDRRHEIADFLSELAVELAAGY